MKSTQIKGLLAGLATVAVIGTAIAQGTPPTTNTPNPATGAGQQSSQGTSMGTTGTPAGASTMNTAPMGSNATTSAAPSADMSATDTTMRADRN